MTAFDRDGYHPDGTPDYSQDNVDIAIKMELNGDGTMNLHYLNVPFLDLDALLEHQGSDEGRAETLNQLGDLLAGLLYESYSFGGPLV
jgi:hypothetical protein